MSRPEIVDKLNSFLSTHHTFTEEAQVVYLLIEIRKILDRDSNMKYPLLRFYCDWCVHTRKDKITPQIKLIMEQLYTNIKDQIQHPAVANTKKSRPFCTWMT
jgi:hypothetical protein